MIKLIMLSGGLDSTYLSWKIMSEGEIPYLCHVHIKNRESVGRNQYKQIKPILSYFIKQKFKFSYNESTFEFGLSKVGFDSDLLLLVAQKVCLNIGKPVQLVMGWNPFDMKRTVIAERAKRNVTDNIWKALIESNRNRNLISKEISFPLIEKNIYKEDMIKEIPKELLDLTWSCRKSKNNVPCGECHACREKSIAVKNLNKKIKNYKYI